MKKIKLTQGKFALVDDCDYKYLNQWKWYTIKSGNTFYTVRKSKRDKYGKQKTILMHRVILQRMGIKFKQTDHIDGNGLNNQRSNLRAATHSENAFNQNLAKDTTSGYKGVHWDKLCQKWRTRIGINGKKIHLGLFDEIKDAARAYNKAAIKHFGKFARINKI